MSSTPRSVGGLGGTYGGNPLACAAALAVLDVMEEEKLPAAGPDGRRADPRPLPNWADALPPDRRRPGARRHDRDGAGAGPPVQGARQGADRRKLLAEALKRGLLLLSAGTYGNVIRVLVPLTVEDAVLDEGLE